MIKNLIKKDLYIKYGALMHPRTSIQDKKERKKLLSLVFSFFVIVFYAVILQGMLFKDIDNMISMGLINLFIISISTAHVAFLIFTILPSIMSSFYFSNDIKIMQGLPIRNKDIIISKFISIFIDSLLISLFLIIPTFLRICYYSSCGIVSYITITLAIFLTNMLVIAIVSLIIIYLMKYLNKVSNLKNIFQSISLVFALVLYFMVTRYLNSVESLMTAVKNFDNSIFKFIPHTFFIVKIFTNNIVTSLLYTLIYGGFVFSIMYFVAKFSEKALQKGIELNSITGTKTKKHKKSISIKKRSIVREIANKEFKEILKTPIYFFNIMAVGIIFMIIFSVGFINAASKDGMSLPMIINSIDYSFGENLLLETLVCLIAGFLYTTFISFTSSTISTITREGKNIDIVKTLPTSSRDQVKGRLLASLWITSINLVLIVLALIIFIFIKSGLCISAFTLPIAFVIGSIISWFYFSNIDLYIGIKFPYFDWDTPQRAVKGGTNPLKSMLFTLVNAFVVFVLYKLMSAFIDNIIYVLIAVSLISMLFATVTGLVIYKININNLQRMLPRYKDE